MGGKRTPRRTFAAGQLCFMKNQSDRIVSVVGKDSSGTLPSHLGVWWIVGTFDTGEILWVNQRNLVKVDSRLMEMVKTIRKIRHSLSETSPQPGSAGTAQTM